MASDSAKSGVITVAVSLEVKNMEELTTTFSTAQQLFHELEDARTPEKVQKCIALFEECSSLVRSESVFSKNEELDDIRTDLLQYLMVDYYLAQLTMQVFDDQRAQTLEKARLLYRKFFTLAHHFKILKVRSPNQFKVEDLTFLEKVNDLGGNQRREEAVRRHQRRAEVQKRLGQIIQQKKAAPDDEELQRDHLLALLEEAVVESMNEWSTLTLEIDMLQKVSAMKAEGQDPLDPRLRPKAPAFQNVKILPNGQVVPLTAQPDALKAIPQAQRQAIRDAAFVPTNNPTMSLTEFHDIMAERTHKQQAEAARAPPSKEEESDSDKEDDEKLQKARAWDDWKDDNPYGSGNRNGNIG